MSILKLVKQANTKEKMNLDNDNFLFGKDDTLDPKFTKIFGINYYVNIYYLKINSPKLDLGKNLITIYLPISFRKRNNQELINTILLKMYTKIAENEIENVMEKARHEFGFAPEEYYIKNIPGTLAYCDKESQTITINPNIVKFSKNIVEYIVFHEFCHLKFKNHTKSFYDMLKKYKPNYEKLSNQISNFKY